MPEKETVCAVVVTYNRKQLLIECLEALMKQTRPLDAIYLIDNASTDSTSELLKEKGYIKEILNPKCGPAEDEKIFNGVKMHYVRMHENTGGAGGFYEGVKRAYEGDYDWLWIMDDDVEAEGNCLESLLAYNKKSQVLIPLRLGVSGEIRELAAINYDLRNLFVVGVKCRLSIKEKFKSVEEMPDLLEVQDMAFEGPLICRKVVEKIGFPKRELFIFGDDTEYSFRIRYSKAAKLILIRKAVIRRKVINAKTSEYDWKSYYYFRNLIWLYKIYGENFAVRHIRPVYFTIRTIVSGLLHGQIRFMPIYIWGFIDGINGNFVNRKFLDLSR